MPKEKVYMYLVALEKALDGVQRKVLGWAMKFCLDQ